MSDYRRWTSEEEQYIRDHWKTQSDAEMATALSGWRALCVQAPGTAMLPAEDLDAGRRTVSGRPLGTVSIPGIAQDAGADSFGDQGSGLKDWALAGYWILATM